MSLQIGILVSFGFIILSGAVFPRINIGILAIVSAFLFGIFGSQLDAGVVLTAFPVRLTFIIVGLSLFFGMLTDNGTVLRIASLFMRSIGGRTVFVPLVVFILTALLTTLGVNNIATTALVAPIAMKLALDIGLSPFLMTLIIVGAASGAAFSPVSLSGAIVAEFMGREPDFAWRGTAYSPWKLYFYTLIGQSFVTFAGFHAFGGTAWIRQRWGARANVELSRDVEKSSNTKGISGVDFERAHLISIGVFIIFISVVVFPSLSVFDGVFPRSLRLLSENVAVPAIIGVAALMLLRVGKVSNGLKLVPWNTVVLIVGMSMLIDFSSRYDLLPMLSRRLVQWSTPGNIFFIFPFAGAFLSAFSSSSGVVLPLFLPMIKDFAPHLPMVDSADLISSLAFSSHVVDASPLSTLGALCIAALSDEESRNRLFRILLIWGLVLVPVGAGLCWLVF